MFPLRRPYSLFLVLLGLAISARALDQPLTQPALDNLAAKSQQYAKIRVACTFVGHRVGLVTVFRRQADELAKQDFLQAAPRYAATLAVLQAAFESEYVGTPPSDPKEQAFARYWNNPVTSADIWTMITDADQTAYRLEDLRKDYASGKLDQRLKGYDERCSELAQARESMAKELKALNQAALAALLKERNELEALNSRCTDMGVRLNRTAADLSREHRDLDDLNDEYERKGQQLHRDVQQFNRTGGSVYERNDLSNRQDSLEEDYRILKGRIAAYNRDADRQREDQAELTGLRDVLKTRGDRFNQIHDFLQRAQETAGALD